MSQQVKDRDIAITSNENDHIYVVLKRDKEPSVIGIEPSKGEFSCPMEVIEDFLHGLAVTLEKCSIAEIEESKLSLEGHL